MAITISNCKTTSGITNTCSDILKLGGAGKTFWVGYLQDLRTPISLTQAAAITTLDFLAYGGLYRFDGQKFAHSFGYELAVASGGNKSYIQTFVYKLFANSTPEDVILQNLLLGDDIFIIGQTGNQEFKILGAGNGMSASAANQNTGTTGDSDVTDNGTLTGQEPTMPLRFDLGTYAATLARIQSYQL